jgi:heme/copper-type cytochrome/quinol oxidase subunit 1
MEILKSAMRKVPLMSQKVVFTWGIVTGVMLGYMAAGKYLYNSFPLIIGHPHTILKPGR